MAYWSRPLSSPAVPLLFLTHRNGPSGIINTFPHFTIHNHMESLTHRNFSFLQIPFLHLFKLVKGRKKKIPILLKFNFGRRQGMDGHLCIDSGWCVIKRNKLSIPLHKIDQVQSRINYLSGESQVVSINNHPSLI